MESYIILCKKEEYLYRYLLEGYLRDGYRIAASYQDLTALSSKEAIEKEEVLLSVVLRRMHQSHLHFNEPLDISGLMEKHYARLQKTDFQPLKFNDPFLWELRQLILQQKMSLRSEK